MKKKITLHDLYNNPKFLKLRIRIIKKVMKLVDEDQRKILDIDK